MKIAETTLPVRAKNALEAVGIETVKELKARTVKELEDVPNLGAKMIRTIERFLEGIK